MVFCHFDRDLIEAFEKASAAVLHAAHAKAAQPLGFIPACGLMKLDAGAEDIGQFAHKDAKVDASVGGEEKSELVAIELVNSFNQFHGERVALQDIHKDSGCFLLLRGQVAHLVDIFLGSDAADAVSFSSLLSIKLFFADAQVDDLGDIFAPLHFHNDQFFRLEGQILGVLVVTQAPGAKFHFYIFLHYNSMRVLDLGEPRGMYPGVKLLFSLREGQTAPAFYGGRDLTEGVKTIGCELPGRPPGKIGDKIRDQVGIPEVAAHANHRSGIDAAVDAKLCVVSHHGSQKHSAAVYFGIFEIGMEGHVFIGVFEVAVVGVGADVDPFPDEAVAQKAIVLLV